MAAETPYDIKAQDSVCHDLEVSKESIMDLGSASHNLPRLPVPDNDAVLPLSELPNPIYSEIPGTPDVYSGLSKDHVEERGQPSHIPIHFRELETLFDPAHEAFTASASPLPPDFRELITTPALEFSDEEEEIPSSDTEAGDSNGPNWSQERSPAPAGPPSSTLASLSDNVISCVHQDSAASNNSTPSLSLVQPSPPSLPSLRATRPASNRTLPPPPPPPRHAHLGQESFHHDISEARHSAENIEDEPNDHPSTPPFRFNSPRPASAPGYISCARKESPYNHMPDHIPNRSHIYFCLCFRPGCLLRSETITPAVSISHEHHDAAIDQHEQSCQGHEETQELFIKNTRTEKAKKKVAKKMAAVKKTCSAFCKKSKVMKRKFTATLSQKKIDRYRRCLETIQHVQRGI